MSRIGINLSAKNGNWKGGKAGLKAIHLWVRARNPQPKICSNCKKEFLKLDLANISGKYLRDLTDWEWLCRKCHMIKDGRLKVFIKNYNNKPINRNLKGRTWKVNKIRGDMMADAQAESEAN